MAPQWNIGTTGLGKLGNGWFAFIYKRTFLDSHSQLSAKDMENKDLADSLRLTAESIIQKPETRTEGVGLSAACLPNEWLYLDEHEIESEIN